MSGLDTTWASLAAIAGAGTWAFASLVFSRLAHEAHPNALNLMKCVVAAPLLLGAGLALGLGWPHLPTSSLQTLAISSVFGLALADTAYFVCLKHLGASRGVLFIPLVPVLTTLLAAIWRDEQLSSRAMVGIAVTLVGVTAVLRGGEPADGSDGVATRVSMPGLFGGLFYVVTQAVSNVLVKDVVVDAPPLHVAAMRIAMGTGVLLALVPVFGGVTTLRPFRTPRLLGLVVLASVIGTFGGLWLGTFALKSLPTGVATTLSATTPIWALAMTRLQGEVLTARALVGASIAILGVALLTS